jgi:hypothetical protein
MNRAKETQLEIEICTALNRVSAENASNTPDYILAQYLLACLAAFNIAVQQRETWYGRDARPSAAPESAASPVGAIDSFNANGERCGPDRTPAAN